MAILAQFNGGSNPEDWIFQAERYFTYLGFPEKDWLPLPFHYFEGEALEWFRWMYRNNQFWDWKHFKEKLAMCFRAPTPPPPESPTLHSQINNILTLLQKLEDKINVSTGIVGTTVSEEIVSPLPNGSSQIGSNFEALLEKSDTSNTNDLLAGTDPAIPDEYLGSADQVFDKSPHQIENATYELEVAFDLVADSSEGLETPSQITQEISETTRCTKIDYPDDTISRKSAVEEDECLKTNIDVVGNGGLQRNEFDLQCQFTDLKFILMEKFVSCEILSTDFDGPTVVEGEASLILRVDDDDFFPCIFNQSSWTDFGELAMSVCMKNALSTRYWFDTGQLFAGSISFVFQHQKYGSTSSLLEFDKNGGRITAFDDQGTIDKIIGQDEILFEHRHTKYARRTEFVSTRQTTCNASTCIWYSQLVPDIRVFVPITSLVVSTSYNLILSTSSAPTHEDKGNTGNNVAGVVSISPLRDKNGYPVAFANQVPFISLYLEFLLHKCNWVDIRQTHILPGYLLYDLCAYKNCNVLFFSLGGVTWLCRIIIWSRTTSSRTLQHYIFVLLSDEANGGESIGTKFTIASQGKKIVTTIYRDNQLLENEVVVPHTGRFNNRLNLHQFSFDPGDNFLVVPTLDTTSNLCVWDPGISFKAMALSVNPVSAKVLQLWGCSGKHYLLTYSKIISRVWDLIMFIVCLDVLKDRRRAFKKLFRQSSLCCDSPCVKQNMTTERNDGGAGSAHGGGRESTVKCQIKEAKEPTLNENHNMLPLGIGFEMTLEHSGAGHRLYHSLSLSDILWSYFYSHEGLVNSIFLFLASTSQTLFFLQVIEVDLPAGLFIVLGDPTTLVYIQPQVLNVIVESVNLVPNGGQLDLPDMMKYSAHFRSYVMVVLELEIAAFHDDTKFVIKKIVVDAQY